MTTLTDGRLTLRSPEAADASAVAEAARTSFPALAPWMPWASPDYGVDDAMFWITNRAETGFIIVGPDNSVLGTCGLNGFDVVMSVENEASRRVAERVGATYEGVLHRRLLLHGASHDAHSFSITTVDQLR